MSHPLYIAHCILADGARGAALVPVVDVRVPLAVSAEWHAGHQLRLQRLTSREHLVLVYSADAHSPAHSYVQRTQPHTRKQQERRSCEY